MRIISGDARGRVLFSPAGDQTRPTSDKIRGSLFNILGSRVQDANVLDLFGGTGAMALEALSRGAKCAVIVDNNRAAFEVIRRNAHNVLKDELSERALLIKSDYRTALSGLAGRRFDLVFLDPPYRMTEAYADAISRMEQAGMLDEDVRILCERRKDLMLSPLACFEIYDTRSYGDTAVDFLRRRQTDT